MMGTFETFMHIFGCSQRKKCFSSSLFSILTLSIEIYHSGSGRMYHSQNDDGFESHRLYHSTVNSDFPVMIEQKT
jgi:hypothetical protein